MAPGIPANGEIASPLAINSSTVLAVAKAKVEPTVHAYLSDSHDRALCAMTAFVNSTALISLFTSFLCNS